MNIVFVVDHYNSITDGTIISARRFEEELIRQGHNVKIVSCNIKGENKFGLKERRIPIVSAVAKKSNVHFAKFDKAVILKAFEDADIVHLFMPFSVEKRALRLAKKMGIPVTAAFHLHPDNILKNMGFKKPPRFLTNFIFWLWRKSFYNKVEHIHCPSLFSVDELKAHKYKSCLHIISNGVAPEFVPKIKTEYTRDRNFEILMVGRLAPEKCQDLLIKAVQNSKYKDFINITFAGSGALKEKYIKMSHNLPNKPSFEFLTKDKLLEKIHASDLYIHAADVEIEGISCLEAFSCGLVPLIGDAEKSAAKQFVIDKRCGFKAGDADSLKEHIEYFIEHPDELQVLSALYSEYSKEFNLSKSVNLFVNMFQSAVNDNKNIAEVKNYGF